MACTEKKHIGPTVEEVVAKYMDTATEEEKKAAVTILAALDGFSIITAKETLDLCKRMIDVFTLVL